MSKALYRKYRSKSLDEIVGQEHITAILKRAIEQDKVAHAYLLTGPKGVGKTSIARILAHALNNLPYNEEPQHLDIIEIDAASNNSVEDVRDLREKVQIAPVSAKRKVYIIDEVHMLSKQAFNALLKTLEEPPEHIVFILATTDADKLPATIISRVQRFNFRIINEHDTIKHLKAIAKKENISIEDEALRLIATHGKGSFRDSIGLLDQMQHVSDGAVTRDMVAAILGLADDQQITDLLQAYSTGDLAAIVALLNSAADSGTPAHVIAEQLIRTIRHSIATRPQFLPLLDDLLDVPKSAWPEIKLLTALTKQTPRNELESLEMKKFESNQTTTDNKNDSSNAAERRSGIDSADFLETEPSEALETSARPGLRAGGESSERSGVMPGTKDPTTSRTRTAPSPNDVAASPKPRANKSASQSTTASVPFDWVAFSEAVKPKAAGAFIILKACGYDFDGTALTIYAGKKFSKVKLEKALPALNEVLDDLGMVAEIMISETAKPPEDATTAAILDMMGGGEELRGPAE